MAEACRAAQQLRPAVTLVRPAFECEARGEAVESAGRRVDRAGPLYRAPGPTSNEPNYARPMIKAPLVPPKPKELVSATSIFASRGSWGTKSRSHSSSG